MLSKKYKKEAIEKLKNMPDNEFIEMLIFAGYYRFLNVDFENIIEIIAKYPNTVVYPKTKNSWDKTINILNKYGFSSTDKCQYQTNKIIVVDVDTCSFSVSSISFFKNNNIIEI